jgi:hypothetical protein
MLRVNLHHDMSMTILAFTSLTEIVILADSTLEAWALEGRSVTAITATSMTGVTILGATASPPTPLLHNHRQRSRQLIRMINLESGVGLLGYKTFTRFTQVIILAH